MAYRRLATLPLAALVCLVGGCNSGEEPPPPPSGDDDPIVRAFDMAREPAVVALGLRVAWFVAHEDRLPKDRQEVEAFANVPIWPSLPPHTKAGRPVAYRPAGDRAFEIVVGDPEGPASEHVVIAIDLPATMPTEMGAEAFATWWELELLRQQTVRLKERLRELGG